MTPGMGDPMDSGDDEYIHVMVYLPDKISKCVDALAASHFTDPDMKPYFFPYIIRLHAIDGATQKDLNAVIPYDKSRISVVVNQLIKLGYVYDDGQGRNSSLHLTEKGERAYPECRSFLDLISKELFGIAEGNTEIRRKNIEFDRHLDELLKQYRQ